MATNPDSTPGSPEIVFNKPDAEFTHGNEGGDECWLYSPAQLRILKVSERLLKKVYEERGPVVSRVERVRAAMVKGSETVYIVRCDKDDPEGLQILRSRAGTSVNIITLLGPMQLTVPTGYRHKFAVTRVGKESPVGPALAFDPSQVLERKASKKKSVWRNGHSTPPLSPEGARVSQEQIAADLPTVMEEAGASAVASVRFHNLAQYMGTAPDLPALDPDLVMAYMGVQQRGNLSADLGPNASHFAVESWLYLSKRQPTIPIGGCHNAGALTAQIRVLGYTGHTWSDIWSTLDQVSLPYSGSRLDGIDARWDGIAASQARRTGRTAHQSRSQTGERGRRCGNDQATIAEINECDEFLMHKTSELESDLYTIHGREKSRKADGDR
jgi:hypothetical protein